MLEPREKLIDFQMKKWITFTLVALSILLALDANAGPFDWPQTKPPTESQLQRNKFVLENKLGSISHYVYGLEAFQRDIQSGWRIILVVNKAAFSPSGRSDSQTLQVYKDGALIKTMLISTALEGLKWNKVKKRKEFVTTPTGRFRPLRFSARHVSYSWREEMPYSVFFYHGYAFHAAAKPKDLGSLGTRASAGCIRLSPEDAHELFDLVRTYKEQTLIVIHEPI